MNRQELRGKSYGRKSGNRCHLLDARRSLHPPPPIPLSTQTGYLWGEGTASGPAPRISPRGGSFWLEPPQPMLSDSEATYPGWGPVTMYPVPSPAPQVPGEDSGCPAGPCSHQLAGTTRKPAQPLGSSCRPF